MAKVLAAHKKNAAPAPAPAPVFSLPKPSIIK